jgi:hypothetical protein
MPAPDNHPFTHSAFENSPAHRTALKIYGKAVLLSTLLISLLIWSVLGIYWGSAWRVQQGVHNLNAWIVDFDGGEIGSAVTEAFLNASGPKEKITWSVVPAANFPRGAADLRASIHDERAWAIVAINSGVSDRLNAAIANASPNYDASQVITAYAAEARNENGFHSFVEPQIREPIEKLMPQFAIEQARRLGASAAGLLSAAPELLVTPIGYTIDNVHPFDIQVADAADFVGLIYLLILSFIAATANFQARTMVSGLENRLNFPSLIALRYLSPMIIYFWLSLVYSLLSLFFKVPFDRQFGHAGFVVYWMLSWCAMMALGLALEAMLTLLTLRFIPFFLVFWIIVNVSVVFFPIEILPTIFRYGYAAPFYNVSRATRTILFGTRNQVGFNFGVLFAWIGVSLLTIPLFQWYVRQKAVKEYNRKQEEILEKKLKTERSAETIRPEPEEA